MTCVRHLEGLTEVQKEQERSEEKQKNSRESLDIAVLDVEEAASKLKDCPTKEFVLAEEELNDSLRCLGQLIKDTAGGHPRAIVWGPASRIKRRPLSPRNARHDRGLSKKGVEPGKGRNYPGRATTIGSPDEGEIGRALAGHVSGSKQQFIGEFEGAKETEDI